MQMPPFDGSVPAESDDLTGVIRNLTPKHNRQGTSERSPNDPDVRWILEAGVSLLVDRFVLYQDDSEVEAYTKSNDLLGAASTKDVMVRFSQLARGADIDPGSASNVRLNHRWGTVSRYQRDLLRYVFRPALDNFRMRAVRNALPEMLHGTFGELVEQLASSETDNLPLMPEYQLQLALQAAFPADKQINELAEAFYRRSMNDWSRLYAEIADSYGLELRPDQGLDWSDVAMMFNSIVVGVYVRRCAHPGLGITSDSTHLSVKTVQLLLSQLTGRTWADLSDRRVTASAG